MKFKNLSFFLILCLTVSINVWAQSEQFTSGTYQVRVSLDRPDWTYDLKAAAKFSAVVTLNNSPVSGMPLKYSCGPEQMPAVIERQITTGYQPVVVETKGLDVPGFYRCIFTTEKDGTVYRGLATAGYRPEQIKAVTPDPANFDKFWSDAKAEVQKIPLDPIMELIPAMSTAKVEVYHVSFQTVGTGFSRISRIFGILAIPRSTNGEKFPGLLRVPGAGVRPYTGQIALAERGIMTLEIGIHGLPVTMPQSVYDNLRAGPLNRYMLFNLDDPDAYYFKRVYLSLIKANDLLTGLPQYNGKKLGVIGGSQGGALAIVTAALDPRVNALAASYPAISDTHGYLAGRAGGWPHAFRDEKMRTKEKLETAALYDVVNFSKRLKVPGLYYLGFNDEVCPPTSMYASYNGISSPKTLMLGLEMGHSQAPEHSARINNWITTELKK